MKSLLILIATNLLLACIPARVLASDGPASHFPVDSQDITCKSETDKYLWVGTNHGLYFVRKKDGRIYKMLKENSNLPSDTITAMAALPNGEVFIGTARGLVRYDNYAFLIINNENSALICNGITSVKSSGSGDVYVGTRTGGVTVFSGLRSRTFSSRNAPFTVDHVISFQLQGADSVIVTLRDSSHMVIANKRYALLESNMK